MQKLIDVRYYRLLPQGGRKREKLRFFSTSEKKPPGPPHIYLPGDKIQRRRFPILLAPSPSGAFYDTRGIRWWNSYVCNVRVTEAPLGNSE